VTYDGSACMAGTVSTTSYLNMELRGKMTKREREKHIGTLKGLTAATYERHMILSRVSQPHGCQYIQQQHVISTRGHECKLTRFVDASAPGRQRDQSFTSTH
jgi:alkylhydroperoxidase family enzyme